MKKVVVFCSLMLFGIVNVSAMKLEIKKEDDIIYYNYESKTIDGNEVFKLSFDEVNEYDKWLVANLAQQAKYEDNFNKVVIQKMILESVNGNYAINVIDNNDVIDTSDNEKNIMNKIEKYNKINDMNGNCYEVNLYDLLTLDNNVSGYYIDDYNIISSDGKTMIDGFYQTGLQKLEFNIDCLINNNEIVANGFKYRPFLIFVNVLGYRVDFIIPDDEIFEFFIYDQNDKFIGGISFSKNNNVFYYGLNKKYKLVSNETNVYEKLDDILLDEKSDVITLKHVIKKYNVSFRTISTSLYEDIYFDSFNYFSLYDINLNKVLTCKLDSCNVIIDAGKYYVVDDITGKIYNIAIFMDGEMMIKRNYIEGLFSNEKIESIKVNDKEIPLFKNNNIYSLEHNEDIRKIEIIINDVSYVLDLFNKDNYWFVDNMGLFYLFNIDKKDEVINKDPSDNEEEKPKDEEGNKEIDEIGNDDSKDDSKDVDIIIEVPNTNMNNYRLVYILKKYYGVLE